MYAYFYFDFHETEKQRSENLIRHLVTKLSGQDPNCPDMLLKLFAACRGSKRRPTVEELVTVLKHTIETFGKVFVVIDALDECTDREGLLDFITVAVGWGLHNLHLLATSRTERDIIQCLGSLNATEVNLQQDLVDNDILIYTDERLQNDGKLKKWSKSVEMQKEIRQTLMEKAQGM